MGLPTPEQLEELSAILAGQAPGQNRIGFWSEEDQRRDLGRLNTPSRPSSVPVSDKAATFAKKTGQFAVTTGVPAAVNAVAHVEYGIRSSVQMAGHTVTIAPLGAALSAWIGITTVAVQAGKVFDLYTLRDDARSTIRNRTTYYCECGKCAGNIQYIIDKKERNVGVVALSVGTLGVVGIGKMFHSVGKKLKSKIMGETRPKERVSREIVASARGGCLAAMGTIFLLSGSWTHGYREKKTMEAAVLTLTATNGWEKLQSNW